MWCKATFDLSEGFTHEYIESTPGCWDAYTKVLVREYEHYAVLSDIHRLTVDTYAVQHPGKPGRKSTQSVIGHLVSMYFVLEKNYSGDQAREQIKLFLQRNLALKWLEPPDFDGTLTVSDVLTARSDDEHILLVKKWATSVFDKWYSKYKEQIDNYVKMV